uniref:Putative DNA-binding response regulator n=1 Tax=mine drainage metagenome TaxID=410659 RepID=E6PYX5_9ZZZZ
MRVLLVEDESRLADNVTSALREAAGFAVDWAATGDLGAEMAERGCYDLVILDLMLPGRNGVSVLKGIRAARDKTPVLILTARAEVTSRISLLNAGADDYLSKPFDLGELLARAKALIRRGKGVADPLLQVGEIELNTLEQTVTRNGQIILLSPTEYRMLEYFMHRPRVVISKQILLEHLYDYNWARHSNVIEVHVSNLRRKLGDCTDGACLETLRGRGYRLYMPQKEEA